MGKFRVIVTMVTWVILTAGSSKGQMIVFLKEPKNVTAFEGESAFFPCTFEGINVAPRWRINNQVLVTSALPRGYSYNRSGLVISSVDLSVNMTTYSCFFSVFRGGGFVDIESTTGYLIIAAKASSSSIHLKPSSSGNYMGPTTHYHATTVFIEPIITASQLQQSLDTLNGRTQPVATERALPLTPMQFSIPLVIGMVVGVGIPLLITTAIFTVICIARRRHTLKRGNQASDIQKEEMGIKMKENVAYEAPPSRIKMTENEAYGPISMANRP